MTCGVARRGRNSLAISFAQFTSVIDIFVCHGDCARHKDQQKCSTTRPFITVTLLCGTNISPDPAYFDNEGKKGHRITSGAYSKRIITFRPVAISSVKLSKSPLSRWCETEFIRESLSASPLPIRTRAIHICQECRRVR